MRQLAAVPIKFLSARGNTTNAGAKDVAVRVHLSDGGWEVGGEWIASE